MFRLFRFAATGVALLVAASALMAAEYTVKQDGTADFTTVSAAINAANANPGADVITILDSATYDEDFPRPTQSLTIQAAPGQTPTLNKNSSASGVNQVISFAGQDGDTFIIRGASPEAKMTVKNSVGTGPILGGGPAAARSFTYIAENLILERPADGAGSTGLFANINHNGPAVLRNIEFVGHSPSAASAAVLNVTTAPHTVEDCVFRQNNPGTVIYLQGKASTFRRCSFPGNVAGGALVYASPASEDCVFEDCDLRPASGFGAVVYITGGNHTFTRCFIGAAPGAPPPGVQTIRTNGAYNGTVTFESCSLGSGGGAGYYRMFSDNSGGTFIFSNPTFLDGCGDVAFHGFGGALNLTIAGSPGAKASFDPILQGGNFLPIRFAGASLTLRDVSVTVRGPLSTFMDSAFEGPLLNPLTVSLERCEFLNGAGIFNLVLRDSVGNQVFRDQPVDFYATNCIWQGNGDDHFIWTKDSQTFILAPATINLKHCTMFGRITNTFIWGSRLDEGDGTTDVLTAEYCIFDAHQQQPVSFSNLDLNGQKNLVYWSVTSPGVVGFGVYPPDTIVRFPALSATGRLNPTSVPAFAKAIGSDVTDDIDGRPRPLPATASAPDLGAAEFDDPTPVDVSSIAQLKELPDGTFARLTGKVVTGRFPWWFYIQDEDRTSGIRVDWWLGSSANVNDRVTITGSVVTVGGGQEKWLTGGEILSATPGAPIRPLVIANKAQANTFNGVGLKTYGLLVHTAGRVTAVPYGNCYYIDDGSGFDDGSGRKGICVYNINGEPSPAVGQFVLVTGCSGFNNVPVGDPVTGNVPTPVIWQTQMIAL